ncbi:MAG TPA: hypothetical protein VFA85_14475 [Terriglobales bacterium]|nr:hypothetical protein [Terriglobales bacterium]
MADTDQEKIAAAQKRQPRFMWLGLALVFAGIAWGIYYFAVYRRPVSTLDGFAKCLTSKGVKMYGAWWCPHCADQKELFGNAFQYVNYVECSPLGQKTQNDVCKQAGLKGYPTWQFADGSRAEGTLHLESLAEKTGCKLK